MELIRGKTTRAIGRTVTLMTLTKGEPLTYAKDLQQDKEPLFDVLDHTLLVVRVYTEAVASAHFNAEKMATALDGGMLATDLADALVCVGLPFRKAHERVGALVADLERDGRDLLETSEAELNDRFP